jgi:hypothetical protein
MSMKKGTSQINSSVDLQQRILKVYDHLYANARTRTPAGISSDNEVIGSWLTNGGAPLSLPLGENA